MTINFAIVVVYTGEHDREVKCRNSQAIRERAQDVEKYSCHHDPITMPGRHEQCQRRL
jgi:hypothetical protein